MIQKKKEESDHRLKVEKLANKQLTVKSTTI